MSASASGRAAFNNMQTHCTLLSTVMCIVFVAVVGIVRVIVASNKHMLVYVRHLYIIYGCMQQTVDMENNKSQSSCSAALVFLLLLFACSLVGLGVHYVVGQQKR